jgi:hypothetical protein
MKYVALTASLVLASAANAAFYTEVESNNTLATANFIGSYNAPGDGIVVDGSIFRDGDFTDHDYFRFEISGPAQIVMSVFGRPNSNTGDSFLELLNSAGSVLASDDNGGLNLFSSLEYNTNAAGTYFVHLTSPIGSNAPNFAYKMIIGLNIVPTPGSLALLGLGGMTMARRRR